MNSNQNKIVAYHPIKVMLAFLIFTEVLFFIGPVKYSISKPLLMVFYFAILNLALYWGYKSGIKKAPHSVCKISDRTICILLILGLLLNIEYLIVKWSTKGLSVSLTSLLFSLSNPGAVYTADDVAVNANIITELILTPFRWAAIPIGIFSWKRLSKTFKAIVILTCIIHVFTWLGIGTRKGLLDLIIIVYFASLASNPTWLIESKKRKKIIYILILSIIAFLVYFIFSNLSRGGISSISEMDMLRDLEFRPSYLRRFKYDTLFAFGDITNYLCGGYQSLSIALSDIGIIPVTFGGQGFSTALYLDRFFGYNPLPHTYMAILENNYGIDMYQCWHSIYLWLANDFTFFGVPVVIYLIGKVFAKSWMDSLNHENAFSYPILAFMAIMVFYFFANNQIISFSIEPFIGCIILYIISRF